MASRAEMRLKWKKKVRPMSKNGWKKVKERKEYKHLIRKAISASKRKVEREKVIKT